MQLEKILDGITGADPMVYASHYKYLSTYYKIKVSPHEFYRNTLLYLVYANLESIPLVDSQTMAFDLGVAALVAKEIHNFGELIAHPILLTLNGTKGEWLLHFLLAFNSGNVDKFENFLSQNKTEIEAQEILKQNLPLLREKISILALMELVFTKTSDSRTIHFSEVAKITKLPLSDVEFLLMKSMSVKLIRGVIDEVDQTVIVSWIMTRVLDFDQIKKNEKQIRCLGRSNT